MIREQNKSPIAVVGRTLARDAMLLARVAAPEDAAVARRIAEALKDPARVARLIGEVDSVQIPA